MNAPLPDHIRKALETVTLDLVQYEVGTNDSAAERAQLSAARAREEREASARAEAARCLRCGCL